MSSVNPPAVGSWQCGDSSKLLRRMKRTLRQGLCGHCCPSFALSQ